MRIAWIDHTINELGLRKTFGLVMRVEYGLELFGARSIEEFGDSHGYLYNFDGLLFHLNPIYFVNHMEIIDRFSNPKAIISNSPADYSNQRYPVLNYEDKESIVKFFTQRQRQTPTPD